MISKYRNLRKTDRKFNFHILTHITLWDIKLLKQSIFHFPSLAFPTPSSATVCHVLGPDCLLTDNMCDRFFPMTYRVSQAHPLYMRQQGGFALPEQHVTQHRLMSLSLIFGVVIGVIISESHPPFPTGRKRILLRIRCFVIDVPWVLRSNVPKPNRFGSKGVSRVSTGM